MSCSVAVVCEAPADRVTATLLADAVLRSHADWLEPEVIDHHRQYRGLNPEDAFLQWSQVKRIAREQGVTSVGFFRGEPAHPDAHTARKALLLFTRDDDHRPEAVLLVRDTDGDLSRRTGMEQARDANPWPFRVVVGLAHTKRECWHIVGFEPIADTDESDRLDRLRQELGTDPRLCSQELAANNDPGHDTRSAKRVLSVLTGDDRSRENACLAAPLQTLRDRGEVNGLKAYLGEVDRHIVPLVVGYTPPPWAG